MAWKGEGSGRGWGGKDWGREEQVSNEDLKKQLDELSSKIARALVGPEGLVGEVQELKSEIADIKGSLAGVPDELRDFKQVVKSVLARAADQLADGPSVTQRGGSHGTPLGSRPGTPQPHASPAASGRGTPAASGRGTPQPHTSPAASGPGTPQPQASPAASSALVPWEPPCRYLNPVPCRHGLLNNPTFNKDVDTCNGYPIVNSDGLSPWISSLGSTLLKYHPQVLDKLDKMVYMYFESYEIHWANPKCNRMFTIMCRGCMGACTGSWAQHEQDANAPDASQEFKEQAKSAVDALTALQHFVNYKPTDALPPLPPPPPEPISA